VNLKKAKRIRGAADYHPGGRAEYEPLQLQRVLGMPQFEKHERTLRSWDPKEQKITTRTVEKIRYMPDGKTPAKPLLMSDGKPQVEFIPAAKPVRLKKGSAKQVYRMLKRMERTVGLDNVWQQLVEETGVPA